MSGSNTIRAMGWLALTVLLFLVLVCLLAYTAWTALSDFARQVCGWL